MARDATDEPRETRVEISKRLVAVNSASSVARRLISVSILVWAHQYLVQRVDADEYAIYPVVASIMVFAPLFTSFLAGGVSRYAVAAYARGEPEETTAIVSSIFPLLAAAGALLLIGGGVFAWQIDAILTLSPGLVGDAQVMFALLVAGFVAQLVALPFTIGFAIRQRFVLSNLIAVGIEVVRLTLLLVLLFGVSTRVVWIVVATVSANLLGLVVRVALSRSMVPELRFHGAAFAWRRGRELMAFGIWTSLGQLAAMIHRGAAPIVLNKLATSVDVTAFHIGALFDTQIRAMSTTAAAPVQPALTAMHATGSHERLGSAFLRGGRYALWAALLVGCPMVVYREHIVDLYAGSQYASAATVMLLLMAVYPLTFSNTMLPKIAVAKAQIRGFFAASITVQAINLALMIYLVGTRGMDAVGPALAVFVTTTTSQLAIFWPMGLRMTDVPLGRYARETLLRGLLPGVVASALWLFLEARIDSASWPLLALHFGAGAAVYVATLVTVCLGPDERNDLKRALDRIRGRGRGRGRDQVDH
ncbi:MAG: hypothetical protein AAF726_14425 [Planctomycetota bacterium]